MHVMRESWTDERLDDFKAEVEKRFNGVDRRFDEVDRRFDKVDGRLYRVEEGLMVLSGRFDALNRTLLQIGGGMLATLVAGILALIATQL